MMINRPDGIASADAGLGAQFRMMLEALWASPVRNRLIALAAALFIVITATAYGQNRLNAWNQPFYDALARRDLPAFVQQLGVFCIIAGVLLVLNVVQRWLGETAKVRMREGLVRDLIGNWMRPGRAFRLAQSGTIGINPDQRLHEDARHLTELSADLGIGLLQASVLLVTFVDVLWSISGAFSWSLGGHEITIPGYMVWAAILYSGAASLLSYRVGRDLIDRDVEHYAREADLRYSLVRVSDHIDAITLSGGEADEARHIFADLAAVLEAMRRIVTGVTRLTWVTAGSGWFTIIAPILVAAPLYFAGRITFGGLMVASGAFMQVQSSLRWFVDNFSTIADWRATLLRVAALRRAMISEEPAVGGGRRIEIATGPAGRLRIDALRIDYPQGSTRLAERDVVIGAGERVGVAAERGAGKTLLFRALAGLWSQGGGRIIRPDGEAILYLPRTPYLPPGTLRAALAYPLPPETYDEPACRAALQRLDLGRLVPLLDTAGRWDRSLPEDERQALAFARALLRRPAWIVIDDCLGGIEAQTLQRIVEVLATDLRASAVLYIGNAPGAASLFTRELHLVRDTAGAAQA
jgi:putative ATP-binding cassette transporter